ncbi:MAG: MerR family transcriptional regulator [Pseudomonadales bacterium]
MLSITQLAKRCGVSRTTVLYYERQGLLLAANRGENGYRWYSEHEVERLHKIVAYRGFGVPVAKLAALLTHDEGTQGQLLQQQFDSLEMQIQQLRLQQRAIVDVLGGPLQGRQPLNKARWSQIMRDAGFSERDMRNWHIQFERSEPAGHLAFLQSLQIDAAEIARIRAWD